MNKNNFFYKSALFKEEENDAGNYDDAINENSKEKPMNSRFFVSIDGDKTKGSSFFVVNSCSSSSSWLSPWSMHMVLFVVVIIFIFDTVQLHNAFLHPIFIGEKNVNSRLTSISFVCAIRAIKGVLKFRMIHIVSMHRLLPFISNIVNRLHYER